mgnify:CR=1 FL=1
MRFYERLAMRYYLFRFLILPIMSCLSFMLITPCYAEPSTATESNIVEIMQKLQYDSDLIQKGFSLNRFELVKEGITRHKVDFDSLRKFNIEVFLSKNNLNYAPIIYSFINNIVEERVSLEYFLSKNQKMKAYESFQKINHRCMQCHALTRGWK